ncbi:MAG: transglutaminase family protein [Paracoccus sp. (in: a-proteobacteria)]|nr:transglutaminase family protein [Paracoccus sp. (in: a-proteobacteria)]
MRLKIIHQTLYRYDCAAGFVVQTLRMTASVHDGQRVVSWNIDVKGGQQGAGFRDGAGDWLQSWTLHGPVVQAPIRVEGVVETTDTAGVLRGHREQINPLVYLRDTRATKADDALRDLAGGVQGADPLDLAHRLSEAVGAAIRYAPGVTGVQTTAAEALALGEGVCQDHAHALIAVARLRDLPARYVSGYLHASADGTPHEAAHAWAEIHIGGLGWVGFDPSNGTCPDDRYVRTGSGLDALDAAPVRGVSLGGAAAQLDVSVKVTQEPEQNGASQG